MSLLPFRHKVMIALPVLLMGGTEVQTLSVVRILVGAGYHVTVCCYYEFDSQVAKRFEEAGAEVLLLKLDRADGRFGFSGIRELVGKLKALFLERRPDIVHVQYLAPGLLPIVAARLAGVPRIISTIHIAGQYVYGWKAKLLLRFASIFCDAFICVSRGVERFWFGSTELFDPQTCNGRLHFTVYNAVDVGRVEYAVSGGQREKLKARLGLPDGSAIGIVGRLACQKGHVHLLEAFAAIAGRVPEASLLVVGDGPDRDSLEAKAAELGVGERVRWLGALPHEEVLPLYAIMDVFAMPSLYEGFGLTAVEAMAAGLPVVASDVEGLNEVVESGVTGYLCPAGDISRLSERLLELLTNSDRAKEMGDQGRKRAMEHFSQERFQKSMLAVYDMMGART